MFNKHDISRDSCQLVGAQSSLGYDWWWHSFTGYDADTGKPRSFFIEFFVCNPALGGAKPVFGLSRNGKSSNTAPSYLMVKAGSWGEDGSQLHKFFGTARIELDFGIPFSISAGEFFLSEEGTRGNISITEDESKLFKEWMTDSGSMSWSLVMEKQVAFNVGWGACKLMRRLQAFEMFWHAEGMKTAYRGEVIWNGRLYHVRPEDCFGYADKNWGKNFTSPWVWLSSCNLKDKTTGRQLRDSAFDIGGGRPKIGRCALGRKLLSAFWIEGKGYEFNFSKFWTFCRTRFTCRETAKLVIWHIEQRTLFHKVVVDISCRKKEMLLLKYESPDGKHRHKRLWSGGNGMGTVRIWSLGKLVKDLKAFNVGCEYGTYRNRQSGKK